MVGDPAVQPRVAMKLIRIATVIAFFLVAAVAVAAIILSYNQDRVVELILDRAREKTGLEISSSGGSVALSSHLAITFWSPSVSMGGNQLLRAAQAEALISYHSLVYGNGLPLFDLVLDRPQAIVTQTKMPAALPRLDESTPAAIVAAVHELSQFTRKLEIVDGSAQAADGSRLVSRVNLVAYTRRHLLSSPWRFQFTLTADTPPFPGSRWAGDFTVSPPAKASQAPAAEGRLWAWNIPADRLYPSKTAIAGDLQGQVDGVLGSNGRANGSLSITVRGLAIKTSKALALGEYSLGGLFDASVAKLELTNLVVRHGKSVMLAGQCQIDRPYEADPQVSILLGGLRADLATFRQVLDAGLFAPPQWLVAASDRMDSGTLRLDEMALDSRLSDLRSIDQRVLRKLAASVSIQDLGVTLPADTKLPPVRGGSAQLNYARGVLTISQGSARIGASTLSEFRARADLQRGMDRAPYEVTLKGNADMNEVYPWLAKTAASIGADPSKWVKRVRGETGIQLRVSGKLRASKWIAPEKYEGTIAPEQLEVAMVGPARSITVSGGFLAFESGRVRLELMRLELHPGAALMRGEIEVANWRAGFHGLSVELQHVPADRWLPLVVPPDQFAAKADVGGKLTVNLSADDPAKYSIDGLLTLGPGRIQFGFIRSPIIVQTATLALNGHDAFLNIPGSRLEHHRLDMMVSVTDLLKPLVRIDAVAQKLDLEALKFVRLPWAPKTPTTFLSGKLVGHVEVRTGNLEKLSFTDLKTDFSRTGGDWRVYGLHATSLSGRVDLEIIGRAADDWIRMKGHVAGMDTGALFKVLQGDGRPLVTGKLFGDFDLWGDANTDFFETLAGKISLAAKDGRLEKFTLLSRLFGLIDLKNWLSAQIPDPRKTGLPFKFFTGDFGGNDGAFYTTDLLLDGPVMDISGKGAVHVSDGTIDMELGVLPFQTVNWIMTKIPLIGKNIAASSNILAAYFSVKGPVRDPRITPEPFTSAAQIVTKILTFPINLISPNTVK